MNGPVWIGYVTALALVVAAGSLVVLAYVHAQVAMEVRRQSRELTAKARDFATEARDVVVRLRHELHDYADLSVEARAKLRNTIDTVETRLRDFDALVEVLHEEFEETALDVASWLRTARSSGRLFGQARRSLLSRRRRARG